MRCVRRFGSLPAADNVEVETILVRRVIKPLDLQEGFIGSGISLNHVVDDPLHPGSTLGDPEPLAVLLDRYPLIQFLSEEIGPGWLALRPTFGITGTALRVARVRRRVAIAGRSVTEVACEFIERVS